MMNLDRMSYISHQSYDILSCTHTHLHSILHSIHTFYIIFQLSVRLDICIHIARYLGSKMIEVGILFSLHITHCTKYIPNRIHIYSLP